MKKLLDEITAVPGITGSCLVGHPDGPICNTTTSSLTSETVKNVTTHMTRIMRLAATLKIPIATTQFHYDNYTVLGMPVVSDTMLLTICDSKANYSLVLNSVTLLVGEVRDEITTPPPPPEPVKEMTESVSDSKEGAAAEFVEDEPQQIDAYLQSYLNQFEEAFAEAIGPVAGMIMEEHVERWRKNGPLVTTRLGELVDSLSEEIDDAALVKSFNENVKKIL